MYKKVGKIEKVLRIVSKYKKISRQNHGLSVGRLLKFDKIIYFPNPK